MNMIDKKRLKEEQPVAWRILSNALKTDSLSHAYLFYGPHNPLKSKMALLVAQSCVCPNRDEDGFACQTCSACQQIEHEQNPDFYWLRPNGLYGGKPLTRKQIEAKWKQRDSGDNPDEPASLAQMKNWSIGKQDILNIQEAFQANAIGIVNQQTYIIEQYDRANASASNSLLKFLEEPKSNLMGILTVDELSNVLPTIVSRCQLIPFRMASIESRKEELRSLVDDENLVSVFAYSGYDRANAEKLLEGEAAFEILEASEQYWKERSKHIALYHLQTGVFSKTNQLSRMGVEFFFHCLLFHLEQENELDFMHLDLRLILLEGIDACRLPLDPALLLDRICMQIRKRTIQG